jgi:aminoglycoside/choline kinase family phosphotransferase
MAALDAWLAALGDDVLTPAQKSGHQLAPASADASFRRYFRLTLGGGSTRIIMDAPPEHENCAPFVKVAGLLAEAGLNAPRVLAQDLTQGFLLLTDLGRETYLQRIVGANARADGTLALSAGEIDGLFRDAIAALVTWQKASRTGVLPPYDAALLRREMDLFPEWFIGRHLGVTLSESQQADLERSFALLIASALEQPRVFVHRDYMPRNLMVVDGPGNPGILDFQDAVEGPLTYDVASLLRDAFISWDEERVIDWSVRYWESARKAGFPVPADFSEFYRQLEWMGLQRHLKVIGIFCRLNYRDGKAAYLADLPRHLKYARGVAERYSPFKPLARLLDVLDPQPVTIGYTF